MRHTILHLRHNRGITCASHDSVAHVDRDMNGVDVMEHVFRGVQLLSDNTQTFSGDIVDLDVRAWFAGTAISAVHISVLDNGDR
jgi:hypothetical protein